MRILSKIMAVLVVALACNCSKSSGPGISIAGSWTVVTTTSTGCTTASDNGAVTFACPATANSACFKFTFTSNGTYTTVLNYIDYSSGAAVTKTENSSGTYSISGNKITATTAGSSSSETDTFVLSGNTMTITSPKNSSTGCVETIMMSK